MNLIPAQLGAEPKKLAVLGVVLLVLVVVFFMNRTSDVPQQAVSITAPAARTPLPLESLASRSRAAATLTPAPAQGAAPRRGEAAIQDFKPTLKLPDGMDVSRIDPALKLDLLARLQKLPLEGGERSVFEFGAAPRPKTPTPTVAKVVPVTPPPPPPPAPITPPKPVIPPIPLKFYGYVSESGGVVPGAAKRAFFLDGEDIVVAGENDVIRNRFRIIRIGVNSAVVEDTSNKNQQTLPLVEELPG
ncbi:MAG: hypothetical protein M3O20_10425 [Acidobacteriota bacterium]|nr:hypothetical protein [Acidobacteriota bacterium]